MSQSVIPFQQAQHRQNVVPVVSVGFFSCHSAEQHEFKCSCIVDVGSNIHQTLRRPPQSHRGAERIAGFDKERAEADHRHENLAETSPQNRQKATERDENHMSRLMKWKIDEMEE